MATPPALASVWIAGSCGRVTAIVDGAADPGPAVPAVVGEPSPSPPVPEQAATVATTSSSRVKTERVLVIAPVAMSPPGPSVVPQHCPAAGRPCQSKEHQSAWSGPGPL